ncbi:hypothetical protein OBBRIDRAFT_886648 [Obba rivulosa]|uniref:Uncharacterized protein n=1 Tax=Obba rivulosa TaxID=1052685 RepID=A0A8E2DM86_9APHY|nr:hypothetical protein OBBRIDRAFT_886648 [Obba rivulosa]
MTTVVQPDQFLESCTQSRNETSFSMSPAPHGALSAFRHSPAWLAATHTGSEKTHPRIVTSQRLHDTPSSHTTSKTTHVCGPVVPRDLASDGGSSMSSAHLTHIRAKSAAACMSSYSMTEPCDDTAGSDGAKAAPRGCSRRGARRRHFRTASTFSVIMSAPRTTPPVLEAAVSNCESLGSFTPTSCPRQSLLSLLAPGPVPPTPRYSHELSRSTPWVPFTEESGRSSPSPPPSTLDSPIPSICRTPSEDNGSDYFPSAPSSAGPSTPAHSICGSPRHLRTKSLHTVLESLEDASKFHVQASCATCKKVGNNFPCCPRCGEMWCSRECRLKGGSRKRHVCSKSGQ